MVCLKSDCDESLPAFYNSLYLIHFQYFYCSFANRGFGIHPTQIHTKMLLPTIQPGVKKSDKNPLRKQKGPYIAAFMEVTGEARISKIIQLSDTPVFKAYDMVYVKGIKYFILMNMAVFTAIVCSLGYDLPDGLSNVPAHAPI